VRQVKNGGFEAVFGDKNRRARSLGIGSLVVAVILGGAILYVRLQSRPPKEDALIANFYTHRAGFERLRDLLQKDGGLHRIARWGVDTSGKIGVQMPPEGDFPVARYKEYLALLKQVNGTLAFRGSGDPPDMVGIGVWSSGWGGDTRHIDVVWEDHEPVNRVSNLDEYYRDPARKRRVFRKIDGNWYLLADW
jgi:hypothetical protein